MKFGWTLDHKKVMTLRVFPSLLLFLFSTVYHTLYLADVQNTWDKNLVANIFAVLVVWDVIWSVMMFVLNGVTISFLGIIIGHPAQILKDVLHIFCL